MASISKCLLPPLAIVAALAATATVPAVAPPDPDFVVAYWRFEEGIPDTRATGPNSILDSSEHKLHGTPINAPVYRANIAAKAIPQADARNSLSLELNGANQRIFVPDDTLFHLTKNLTVEAWINVRSNTPSGSNAQILFRGDDRPGLDPYFLAVQGNKLAFSVQNATNHSAAVIAPLPGLNQWIHVAGTLDDASGEIRLYINGASAAQLVTAIRPLGALDPTQNPGIGIGGLQSAGQYFNGLIDEIRISSQALHPDRFLNANSTREPKPGLTTRWSGHVLAFWFFEADRPRNASPSSNGFPAGSARAAHRER